MFRRARAAKRREACRSPAREAGLDAPEATPRPTVGEIARLFLRMGLTAFGGPAAHIAVFEEVCVRERRWLTREAFLDKLALASALPGPHSTELAMLIGREQRGLAGLIAAGLAFLVPACVLTTVLAWAAGRWGALPEARGVESAVQAVLLVVVAQSLLSMGRGLLQARESLALAGAATLAYLAGAHELLVLGGTALVALIARDAWRGAGAAALAAPAAAAAKLGLATGVLAAGRVTLGMLFMACVRTGALLFGSGYVLIIFAREEFVTGHHWVTDRTLLDAVAAGQLTPGPLFATAAFLGYRLAGVAGATVASAGIFLPAFVYSAVSGPFTSLMRRDPAARAALHGLTVASLALFAVTTVRLSATAVATPRGMLLAAVAVLLLASGRVRAAWLLPAAALVGALWRG